MPDFRFVIGAALATALLAVTAFGFAVSLRLTQQARVGPLEASRSMAYAAPADWNQFHDPAGTRRFDQLDIEGTLAIDRALSRGEQRAQEEQTASIPAPANTPRAAESNPPVAAAPVAEAERNPSAAAPAEAATEHVTSQPAAEDSQVEEAAAQETRDAEAAQPSAPKAKRAAQPKKKVAKAPKARAPAKKRARAAAKPKTDDWFSWPATGG